MNANDSRPARMAAAIASIGNPARSQAVARRTLGRSTGRTGAGPSRGTRMPRSTRRPISASVTPASLARPAAVRPSMPPSYAAPGSGDERSRGAPGALGRLVAALVAQAQVQLEGLEQGLELGRLPAADAGGPLHHLGHAAHGPLVGGEPVGPRGLLEGGPDRVSLVTAEP